MTGWTRCEMSLNGLQNAIKLNKIMFNKMSLNKDAKNEPLMWP